MRVENKIFKNQLIENQLSKSNILFRFSVIITSA